MVQRINRSCDNDNAISTVKQKFHKWSPLAATGMIAVFTKGGMVGGPTWDQLDAMKIQQYTYAKIPVCMISRRRETSYYYWKHYILLIQENSSNDQHLLQNPSLNISLNHT